MSPGRSKDNSDKEDDPEPYVTPERNRNTRPILTKSTKTWHKQKFRDTWLQDKQFKGWLLAVEDRNKCKCKACGVFLNCGRSELLKHSKSKKHQENVQKISKTTKLEKLFDNPEKQKLDNDVKRAELKLANFFAEHNVAFSVVDHMIPLLKSIFPDSKVTQNMQLGRTKCTNVITNVLAKKETDDIVKYLRVTHFSVMIDESTDISVNKLLCLVVKFIDAIGKICTEVLELITIDGKDGSAEKLYKSFKECMIKHGIPLTNVIGLACDNASVMVGRNNSFKTRLEADTTILITIPCICHSSAIVASKACAKLPRTPEEFMRSVATYFSYSAKRCSQLSEVQTFFQVENKKILKLCSTRWLSLHNCVETVLENWEVLKNYFTLAVHEDNTKQSQFIWEQLNNDCTRAFLLFLKHVLNYFNSFNALFQSNKILIHDLSKECTKILKQLMVHFVKHEYMGDLRINFANPRHYVELDTLDLGYECNDFVKNMPNEIATTIRKHCLEFFIVACQEIQQRFPIDNELFNSLTFLSPKVALSETRPDTVRSLASVTRVVKLLNETEVDIEWRKLPYNFDKQEKESLHKMEINEFWHELSSLKNFDDTLAFPNLCKLAKIVMSFPHSNADTERVFSVVNDLKTKKRNRVGADALNAVTVIRSALKNRNETCVNFCPTHEHFAFLKSENLYK